MVEPVYLTELTRVESQYLDAISAAEVSVKAVAQARAVLAEARSRERSRTVHAGHLRARLRRDGWSEARLEHLEDLARRLTGWDPNAIEEERMSG